MYRTLFLKQGHSKSIPRTWNVVLFFFTQAFHEYVFFAEAFQVPSPKALKNSRLAFHVYAFHVAWTEFWKTATHSKFQSVSIPNKISLEEVSFEIVLVEISLRNFWSGIYLPRLFGTVYLQKVFGR